MKNFKTLPTSCYTVPTAQVRCFWKKNNCCSAGLTVDSCVLVQYLVRLIQRELCIADVVVLHQQVLRKVESSARIDRLLCCWGQQTVPWTSARPPAATTSQLVLRTVGVRAGTKANELMTAEEARASSQEGGS